MSLSDIVAARHKNTVAMRMSKWTDSLPPGMKGYELDDILRPSSSYTGLSVSGKSTLVGYLNSPTLFLILQGGVGLGKTIIGANVCTELLRRSHGTTARYVESATFLNDASFRQRELDVIRDTSAPDIVLFDDVGASFSDLTPARRNALWAVINQRWTRSLYTVMTTNLPLDSEDSRLVRGRRIPDKDDVPTLAEWFGESAWDRISSCATVVQFSGSSLRKKIHDERKYRDLFSS